MQIGMRAARRDPAELPLFVDQLAHDNEIVRYWAVMGLLMLGAQSAVARDALDARFPVESSMHVRIAAAEALLRQGGHEAALDFLSRTLRSAGPDALRLQAANALANIGEAARPALLALVSASLLDASADVRHACRHTAAVLNGRYSPQKSLVDA